MVRDRRRRRLRLWLLLALAYASVALAWYNKQRDVPFFVEAPTPTVEVVVDETLTEYQEILARGDLYFQQGNLTAALESYQEAVAADPEQAIAYARWAKLLNLRYKTDEALIRSERAITLAPDDVEVLGARVMSLTWDGQFPAAIELAQRALTLDPNSGEIHAFLAEAFMDSDVFTDAYNNAEEAVGLEPDNVWTWLNMGYVNESLGYHAEALAAYQQGIDIAPLSYLYNSMGRLYLYNAELNDIDAAIAAFQEAVYVDPRNPEAYAELSNLYMGQEDPANAKLYALQGIEQDASFARNHALLGQLYYQELNFEGAVSSLEQAVNFGYENPTTYVYLGLAHAYLDQCDAAVPWLERALIEIPDSGPAHTGLQICGIEAPPTAEAPPAP